MTLTVPHEDIKNYLRLSILSEITPLKEQNHQFERKYEKKFTEFVVWMKNQEENFEVWSDYLEWSANEGLIQELSKKLMDVENAQHFEVT